MRVRLTINIGTQDAERLKLPATRDGSEFDVPDHVAETLVLRGWATAAKRDRPDQLHAVPSVEIQADVAESSGPEEYGYAKARQDHINFHAGNVEPQPDPEPEAVEEDEPDGGDEAPDHEPRRRRGRPKKLHG